MENKEIKEKLSQEDIEYIHSEEFINKFGDWEKANRLEKLKVAPIIEKDDRIILDGEDITGMVESLIDYQDRRGIQGLEKEIGQFINGEYKNNDTNLIFSVSNKNAREIANHHYFFKEHIQSMLYVPEIIEKGTFIGEVENQNVEKHRNIKKYLYFATGLKINGNDYTCKSVIGVDDRKNYYYDQSLSTIEKGRLVDNILNKERLEAVNPINRQDSSEPTKEKPGIVSSLITQGEVGLSEEQKSVAVNNTAGN